MFLGSINSYELNLGFGIYLCISTASDIQTYRSQANNIKKDKNYPVTLNYCYTKRVCGMITNRTIRKRQE